MTPAPKLTISDDDDAPVGRVLSRREVLTLLGGGAGTVLPAACMPQALSSASATAPAASSAGASASAAASASGVAAVPSCVMVPELGVQLG